MQQLLLTAKAFSEPTRVRVIRALLAGELCVCELCDAMGVVQSTLSTHLQFLRQAGLVVTRQEGKWIYYALTPAFAGIATAMIELHAADVKRDAQLKTDAVNLKKRLALREDGSCCLGFVNPLPKVKGMKAKPQRATQA